MMLKPTGSLPIPLSAPSEAQPAGAAPIVCDAMLLRYLFERIISVGRLCIVDADGRSLAFEGSPGTSVAIRLHDPALHWKLLVRPRLFLPEAYVDGTLTIEDGSLYDLMDLIAVNIEVMPEGLLGRHLNGAFSPLRRLYQYNPLPRAQRNVAHHYDLSDELYDLFLDHDRQYSCGYFRDGTRRPRHRPARQEAAYCREAAAPTGAEGAGHRLRLGRPRALPCKGMRRRS